MKENIIKNKTFSFALKIVTICRHLIKEEKEFVLSNQLMRSGTSVGALVREAEQAESKKDFIHKLSIALKEANETEYWIELLNAGKFITEETFKVIQLEINEIIRILTKIILTSKTNINKT